MTNKQYKHMRLIGCRNITLSIFFFKSTVLHRRLTYLSLQHHRPANPNPRIPPKTNRLRW